VKFREVHVLLASIQMNYIGSSKLNVIKNILFSVGNLIAEEIKFIQVDLNIYVFKEIIHIFQI